MADRHDAAHGLSIGSYIRYLAGRFRREPATQLLFDGLGRLGVAIQPFYLFEESVPAGEPPAVDPELRTAVVRQLGPEDAPSLASVPWRRLPEEFFAARFRQGNGCIGMFDRGQLAAFTWYDSRECNFEGWRFPLREDEAYLFDAFTLTPWRGKGVAPLLRYRVYQMLAKQGRTKLFSVSIRTNRAALRFKEKLGAKIVGRGWVVELFGRWRLGSKPPERPS
jgi:GNAT superfamily N-acetyltransferase